MKDGNEELLIQAPCGIFSFTEDGVITMANPYCCKLLEYEFEELKGTNISALLTLSGKIFYQTHLYPLVKLHQHTEEIFLNLKTKSKKDLPVVLNAAVIQTNNKSVIVFSFIQVLNRRKYEDEILLAKTNAEDALRKNETLEKVKHELELQQKELDKQVTLLKFQNSELVQLSNVITHDLQEPVRKLILFSNELLKEPIETAKKDYALSVIKKSSQRIKTLLLNLQDYLGLTSLTPVNERVNLEEVLQYGLQQLQKVYTEITVQLKIAPLPVVTGNEKQLHLLFYHILKNAFDHGTIENNLVLSVKAVIVKENLFNSLHNKYTYIDYVKISITDKGPGFDNQFKEYIFDVLKRLDLSGDATGFGLAFCKRIAENHFGNIKAESSVGLGATFTIMLPVDYAY